MPDSASSTPEPTFPATSRHRLVTDDANGFACGLAAFVLWGILPLYWRLLDGVASMEIVGHRILWSFLLLTLLVRPQRASTWEVTNASVPAWTKRFWPVLGIYLTAAILISINWYVFIWAVETHQVVEASLGYYINPLLNVAIGVAVLRERLLPAQAIAIAFAAIGVMVLALGQDRMPWLALSLAGTFALYGLVKKFAPLGAMKGLWIETAVLLLPAASWIALNESKGQGVFSHRDWSSLCLLVLGGAITIGPLVLFGRAAQRLRFSTIGILQFIAPTLQFLLGVLLFHEPFGWMRAIGFIFVWLGCFTFLFGNRFSTWRTARKTRNVIVNEAAAS